MLKRINSSLLFIILTALIFRFVGLNYGFPFIFHPDEPTVVRSALGLRFNLNPEHFDWPHLYFYLNYFLYMLFAKFRDLASSLQSLFPILWDDELIFYLLTRALSAIFGALTCIPIYLIGKNLFNNKVALVSALIFALMPFHIKVSHYTLIDVPMVFFLSCALYFATQVYLWGNYRDYLLGGLFAGLAASTKYNGGLIVLSILLAHLFRYIQAHENVISFKTIKQLSLAAVTSIIGFLIGTPYALLDYKTFLITDGPKGALWQFANVGKVSFGMHIWQFLDAIILKISDDLGYTFIILFVLGIVFLTVKEYKNHISRLLFLVIPAVVFIFYISGFEKNRSHYYMIAYPFMALIAGFALVQLLSFLKKKTPALVLPVFFIVFLIPLVLVCIDDYGFARPDTRVLLYDWMQDNVTERDYIVYGSNDLKVVTDRFEINPSTKLSPNTILQNGAGYVIISPDDEMQTTDIQEFSAVLRKEVEFYPNLRKGPPVIVYSFGKND